MGFVNNVDSGDKDKPDVDRDAGDSVLRRLLKTPPDPRQSPEKGDNKRRDLNRNLVWSPDNHATAIPAPSHVSTKSAPRVTAFT